MSFIELQDPFQKVYRDSYDKQNIFKKLEYVIPYRGTTSYSSHGTLKFLYQLTDLSSSHATCINYLSRFAFGGDVDIITKGKAGLKYTNPEVDPLADESKEAYCEYLENFGLTLPLLRSISQQCFRHLKISGNAYLHYMETRFEGLVRVTLRVIHPMSAYIVRKPDDLLNKSLLICHDLGKLHEKESRKFVDVYPNFSEKKDFRETIFHLKNDTGESDDYGYPDSWHTQRDQAIEALIRDYSCKVAGSAIVTKKILTIRECQAGALPEGTTPQQIAEQVRRVVEKVMSNKGKKSSEIAVNYIPFGYEAEWEDLTVNRNHEWKESDLSMASSNIYAAHMLHKSATGAAEQKSSLGSNAQHALINVLDETIVRKHQHDLSAFICLMNKPLAEASGNDSYLNYRLEFTKTTDNVKNEELPNQNVSDGTQDAIVTE